MRALRAYPRMVLIWSWNDGLMVDGPVAFVLGGGGVLGAVEVGMLRALFRAGFRPDVVVGTSIGAVNGALVAADPSEAVTERLVRLWASPEAATATTWGGFREPS